ncbi:MAG: hypothetical protein MUP97_02580, partial [Acidimicrobiia bacterium]|nr:hypothetical protein [Acidimicrobiia bacterium]
MGSRVRRMRVGRSVLVVATIGAALVAPASPALAQDTPPGWQGSSTDPNAWVAFTISPNPVPTVGRGGSWGPIQLTRNTNLAGTDAVAAFSNWDAGPDLNNDSIPDYPIWPSAWSAGGLDLAKAEDCPATSDSCHYFVTGGSGSDFFVAAGTPVSPDGGVTPPVDLNQYQQHISLAPPKDISINFSWSPATNASPAAGATPGHLTLDASASDGVDGELVFDWTVVRQKDLVEFTKQGSTVVFDLDADDVYCVSVKVTNTTDN